MARYCALHFGSVKVAPVRSDNGGRDTLLFLIVSVLVFANTKQQIVYNLNVAARQSNGPAT